MSINNNSTINDIRAANRKGFSMLDNAHRIVFVAWQDQFMAEHGRTVSTMLRDQHVVVYTKLAELYRLMKSTNVKQSATDKFEHSTSPWLTRVRNRAACIRDASLEVATLIQKSAPANKIGAAKARVKQLIAS